MKGTENQEAIHKKRMARIKKENEAKINPIRGLKSGLSHAEKTNDSPIQGLTTGYIEASELENRQQNQSKEKKNNKVLIYGLK